MNAADMPGAERPLSAGAETRALLSIAGPLIASYAAEFAILLTTKIIVGRLGYLEFGAIGLASDASAAVTLVLVSLFSIVGVLVAQADGAGRPGDAGLAGRQGLILATLIAVPAMILVWNLDGILALTGQDPEVIALMGPYLGPHALSILPMFWFFVLRTFVAALARTQAVMVITVLAVGLNWALCTALVEGAWGLPEMGVAGAGWARVGVTVFMLAALAAYTYLTPNFRGYGLFHGRIRIDWRVIGEIVRLGLPVVAIVALETGMFTSVSIFSGILGPIALATYHVMLAWLGIAFMTARGLAEAGMVRVAWGVGRGSRASARRSGLLVFALGTAWLTMLAAVPLSFPETLVSVFLSRTDPGFEQVLARVAGLLVLAAFFQIFDGLQVLASLALRGLRDTVVPLWLAAIGYLLVGVLGGWALAFPLGLKAEGLWWGMASGLTVTGTLLAIRFAALTRPGRGG